MAETIAVLLLLVGAAFLLLASVAAIRMPDLYCRLSASTKAVTFGASTMFIAIAVFYNGNPAMTRAIAGIVFFFITAPVAAHVLARAAHIHGTPLWSGSVVDEFEADTDHRD